MKVDEVEIAVKITKNEKNEQARIEFVQEHMNSDNTPYLDVLLTAAWLVSRLSDELNRDVSEVLADIADLQVTFE